MVITNKYITGIVRYFYRNKMKHFSFSYEEEVHETDVVDQTYVRHYINNLQEAVDKEIELLTKEYKL